VALPYDGAGGKVQPSKAPPGEASDGPPRPQRAVPPARTAAVTAAVEPRPLLRRQLQWLIGIRLILAAGFGLLARMEFVKRRRL